MRKINTLIAICTLCITVTAFDSVPTPTADTNATPEAVAIGLDTPSRTLIVEKLITLLANEYVLYTKTLKYHWNVIGLMFNDLHLFFGKQYQELFTFIDALAERIRALGYLAPGTLEEFKTYATLQEKAAVVPNHVTMLTTLLNDHEFLIRELRAITTLSAELKDYGTENFLSDLIGKHEKMAWMLRSYTS